jgi:hypothetical protein
MEASNMAWELSVFWMIRGHTAEGLQWYERVLALPLIPPAAEAKALYGAALMWYSQAELAHARIALDRTLTLARGAGDKRRTGLNLSGMSSTPPAHRSPDRSPQASPDFVSWPSRGASECVEWDVGRRSPRSGDRTGRAPA